MAIMGFPTLRATISPLCVIALCLAIPAPRATAQQINSRSVEGMWALFTEKCGLFLDDPNAFVQSPDLFAIQGWKWIMRGASTVGFVEYYSTAPDYEQQFTAIGNATSQGVSLECSLDGLLAGATNAIDAFNIITSHFAGRSDVTYLSEEVTFYGDPGHVAELKQHYSTSHLVRIEGGFENTGLVATIRTDDGGAVYFEVGDMQ